MIIVGLTGSIATGKSTVAGMLKELGAYLIDFDVLAREVVRPHLKAWKGVVEYFGADILNEDSTLDRQRLAEIVFNDAEKLKKLNQIVHPAVFEEDHNRVEEISKRDPSAIIVKDIPLLIEGGYQKFVDRVVVVAASRDNQLRRLMNLGLTADAAQKRIAAQLPIEKKVEMADFVIQNDGSLQETRRQVEEIFANLSRLKT